eukprot:Hpha_TRINITY_DN16836_c0_g2::TRINITY_DN16836_c0_g2_i1::g.149660::m.149660
MVKLGRNTERSAAGLARRRRGKHRRVNWAGLEGIEKEVPLLQLPVLVLHVPNGPAVSERVVVVVRRPLLEPLRHGVTAHCSVTLEGAVPNPVRARSAQAGETDRTAVGRVLGVPGPRVVGIVSEEHGARCTLHRHRFADLVVLPRKVVVARLTPRGVVVVAELPIRVRRRVGDVGHVHRHGEGQSAPPDRRRTCDLRRRFFGGLVMASSAVHLRLVARVLRRVHRSRHCREHHPRSLHRLPLGVPQVVCPQFDDLCTQPLHNLRHLSCTLPQLPPVPLGRVERLEARVTTGEDQRRKGLQLLDAPVLTPPRLDPRPQHVSVNRPENALVGVSGHAGPLSGTRGPGPHEVSGLCTTL